MTEPSFDHVPEPPLGQLNLVRHSDGSSVAVFDPRTGTAERRYTLGAPEPGRDARVRGRYEPLRSGALAIYRDGAGRVVVQHGRRQVVVPDGAPIAARSVGPLLTVTVAGKRVRAIDARGRPGRALLRDLGGRSAGEWV